MDLLSVGQDKEIYRWPIKESIKAMLAWEWTLEKARDGEEDIEKKAATRKISQTAQVKRTKRKSWNSPLNISEVVKCLLTGAGHL